LGSHRITDSVGGIDSLQALLLGIECLRFHLKQSGVTFTWLGDSVLMTMGGIPRQVPPDLGRESDLRIESAIQREIRRTRKFRAKIHRQWFAEGSDTPRTRKRHRPADQVVSLSSHRRGKTSEPS